MLNAGGQGLANRLLTFRVTAVSICVCLSSIGLYLLGRDASSQNDIQHLIRNAYNSRRPGGGRLTGALYSAPNRSPFISADLPHAQLLLLSQPDSARRQDLQGQIYLATGDWRKFIDLKNNQSKYDFETLNNLGVSFLALSD